MADDEDAPRREATATEKKGSGGNIVTRKLGPLPVWAWVGIGAAGLLFLRSRRGSTAAPAVGPTSAVTGGGLPVGGYTGGADNVGLASLIQQLQQRLAVQQPSYTDVSSEKVAGGGYGGPAGWTGGTPIVTQQGSFLGIANPTMLQSLQAAGQSVFVQTAPGVFTSIPAEAVSAAMNSGTNIWQQVAPPQNPTAPISGTNPFPIGA